MPMQDRFAPDEPLPRFLSDRLPERAGKPARRAGKEKPRRSTLLLNASLLAVTTALIGVAFTLSWGDPVKVLTEIKAQLIDTSSVQPDTVQSTETIQATATTRSWPPGATDAPARDESRDGVPAPPDSADQKQASGALLEQFQSWAAQEDGRVQAEAQTDSKVDSKADTTVDPHVEYVRPVEEAATRSSQDTREDTQAPVRSVQRHRAIRPLQNARAQMRSVRKPAPTVRRVRPAQVEARPAQDVRAQDQSGQSAAPSSFLYWRQ